VLYALSPLRGLPAQPFDQALALAVLSPERDHVCGWTSHLLGYVMAVGALLVRLNSPGAEKPRSRRLDRHPFEHCRLTLVDAIVGYVLGRLPR